jgi:GNAT superfamily N-acetyltransferase
MAIRIRLGGSADVEAAVAVYERSNLARRQGVWPNRTDGVARLRASLLDPNGWFLVVDEEPAMIGMASAKPLRGQDGAGPVIAGGCFLGNLFVVPERWGQGIGGRLLDAVLAQARQRHYTRIELLTHEDNERSHRLYRSRDGQGGWARDIGSP